MKKILLVIFLTLPSISFAEGKIFKYKTCAGISAISLDKCVNYQLGQGFELYGQPWGEHKNNVADASHFQALVKKIYK